MIAHEIVTAVEHLIDIGVLAMPDRRTEFAKAAMQGILAKYGPEDITPFGPPMVGGEKLAAYSIACADAMIAALDSKEEEEDELRNGKD